MFLQKSKKGMQNKLIKRSQHCQQYCSTKSMFDDVLQVCFNFLDRFRPCQFQPFLARCCFSCGKKIPFFCGHSPVTLNSLISCLRAFSKNSSVWKISQLKTLSWPGIRWRQIVAVLGWIARPLLSLGIILIFLKQGPGRMVLPFWGVIFPCGMWETLVSPSFLPHFERCPW